MSVSSHHHAPAKQPLLSDRSYTTLKHSAAIALPALSALYFALSQIWHLPHTEQVMASIAALNTAVGTLVGVSTLTYNKTRSTSALSFEPRRLTRRSTRSSSTRTRRRSTR